MRRIFVSSVIEGIARWPAAGAGDAADGGLRARHAARRLWVGLCRRLAAWRNRRADAYLYMQLSKLSDVELQRRGIARGDLHRLVSERSEP
jgi:hypothetical protein